MNNSVFLPLIVTALCFLPLGIQAEQDDSHIGLELEAGLEHDSSLTVEELDRSIDESGVARLTRAKLDGQWKFNKRLTFKGGYSYFGKNYRNTSDFDIVIHQLFVDGSYDFGPVTVGSNHFFADAQLDKRDLLTLNQSGLYLSKLINQRLFIRLAADFKDKEFDGRPERDADAKAVSGDVYWFFNNAKSYVSFGVGTENEDANSAEFDYQGIGFKSKVSNKFQLLGKESKLALGYRYKDRDYDNANPLIGIQRADTRHTTELTWELWFNEHLAMVSSLAYNNYNSNLGSANYSESLASFALRLKML